MVKRINTGQTDLRYDAARIKEEGEIDPKASEFVEKLRAKNAGFARSVTQRKKRAEAITEARKNAKEGAPGEEVIEESLEQKKRAAKIKEDRESKRER